MNFRTGWNLPPGVTDRMIDEAAGAFDEPPDECPDCGSKGECAPACPSREPNYEQQQERYMEGFHWREGMYFRRIEDGSVQITQTQGGGNSEHIEWQRTIPPREWASIVAAVSAAGENAGTYRDALTEHMKGGNPSSNDDVA